jgi:hypothetical protein
MAGLCHAPRRSHHSLGPPCGWRWRVFRLGRRLSRQGPTLFIFKAERADLRGWGGLPETTSASFPASAERGGGWSSKGPLLTWKRMACGTRRVRAWKSVAAPGTGLASTTRLRIANQGPIIGIIARSANSVRYDRRTGTLRWGRGTALQRPSGRHHARSRRQLLDVRVERSRGPELSWVILCPNVVAKEHVAHHCHRARGLCRDPANHRPHGSFRKASFSDWSNLPEMASSNASVSWPLTRTGAPIQKPERPKPRRRKRLICPVRSIRAHRPIDFPSARCGRAKCACANPEWASSTVANATSPLHRGTL